MGAIGITLSESGQLTVDTSNNKYQELIKDDLTDLEIKYQVEDDKGSSSLESAFRLKVSGANDTATISGTAAGEVTEDKANANKASGTLTVSDVDKGQALFQAPASLDGTYGTYTSNTSSGAWAYTLDNTKDTVQALTAGQKVVDHLVVQSLDGTASQSIDVTITGANEAPVIQVIDSDSDQVVLTESNQILSASGTLTVTDPDHNDSIVSSEVIDVQLDPDVPSFLTVEQFASVQPALKSLLTLSAAGTMADPHNLKWTFDSASDNNLDLIPEDAALALKYTIEVKDTSGSTTRHVVSVKINGTNDAPAIEVELDGTDHANLIETNSALKAQGTVSLLDMDLTDVVSYEVSDVALKIVPSFLSADDFDNIKEQVKGFMTLEATDYLNVANNLQWTFDSTGDLYAGFIPGGQTLSLDYTVTATDKSGQTATHVITIDILGTNATPRIEFKGGE